MAPPEILAWLLPLVNAAGLGFVGWGLYYLYKTLLERNTSLEKHITELRNGHTTVVEIMQRRATELEHRFDDEKRWRNNIVEVVGLTEQQQKKLFVMKDEETQQLRLRCEDAVAKLAQAQSEIDKLRHDSWESKKTEVAKTRLETENAALRRKVETLESRADSLQNALTRNVPNGFRGIS